jgi:putative radical SAM enzyme (TIGR03279 family)
MPSSAVIARVAKGSPAEEAGIRAGDRLISINGGPVRDYVDYKFLSAEDRVVIEIMDSDRTRRTVVIEKHADQDPGLSFVADVFDGMRLCHNRCIFCFYDQLPRGLRETLYVRDDDFRLSFLHGNYITLTNLAEDDVGRICEQRLSPLYISVHATQAALRRRMLGNPRTPDVLDQMRRLAGCGIEMHAQIVLCPGLNDRQYLARTVRDLAALHPAVVSVAIVPVGLTAHRAGLTDLQAVGANDARQVLEQIAAWQREFLSRFNSRFVFASDELHLLARKHLPAADEYEGFPQRENGVGLARLFLDEIAQSDFCPAAGLSVTLVTGVSAAGMVKNMAAQMRRQGVKANVVVVRNRLLGETVTVAGLLAGEDVAAALARRDATDCVVLPASALRDDEFLDGVTVKELSRRVGKRIIRAAGPRQLASRLRAHRAKVRRHALPLS